MTYPFIASWLNSLSQSHIIDGYVSSVATADTQDIEYKFHQAEEYNNMLLQSTSLYDPFSVEAYDIALDDYHTILDTGGGLMGYLDIPKIKVHLPIYHGTAPYALHRGVGHLESTSFPVGGNGSHAVLSAHSGLTGATMFDHLEDLQAGDLFSVTVLNRTVWYIVTGHEIVLPDNISSLGIQPDKDLCTLVTCTPYGINSHRLLVHGERCAAPEDVLPQQDQSQEAPQSEGVSPRIIVLFLGVSIFIIASVVTTCKIVSKSHKNKLNP